MTQTLIFLEAHGRHACATRFRTLPGESAMRLDWKTLQGVHSQRVLILSLGLVEVLVCFWSWVVWLVWSFQQLSDPDPEIHRRRRQTFAPHKQPFSNEPTLETSFETPSRCPPVKAVRLLLLPFPLFSQTQQSQSFTTPPPRDQAEQN